MNVNYSLNEKIMGMGWNFPNSNYGKISGISEAGIETFKGALYVSLAREICQNSLDARLDMKKPVVVEFALENLILKKDPRVVGLREVFEKCIDYWGKTKNNAKTMNFLNKAHAILSGTHIKVLRISDFNTTGLTGSDEKINSSWQNLVKSSGVSDKGGSSGGSFGIGKSAPFACSDLRVVFYSTRDKDGLKASQGVANLISFEKDNDMTQGVGYYGIQKDNSPIKKIFSFNKNFFRKDTGTDIFILGFIADEDWQDEIIKSILENYLISIYEGNLVVKIEGVEIRKSTLENFMEKYKDEISVTYNYYQVLKEVKEPLIYNFEDLGNLKLYLSIKKNFERKILMARSNGMKIFDMKGISSAIQFSGVCILEDEKINAYFREMETPQHDKWEPARHSNPKEAKKMRTALNRFIKETVFTKGRESITDEMDAVGLGEYVPDLENINSINDDKDKNREAIVNEIKEISLEKIETVESKGGNLSEKNTSFIDEIETMGESILSNEEELINAFTRTEKAKKTDIKNENLCKNAFGFETDKSEDTDSKVYKKVSIIPKRLRLFVADGEQKRYKVTFTLEEDMSLVILEIFIAGEQGKQSLQIKDVHGYNNKALEYEENKIKIRDVKKEQTYNIFFTLKEEETYSMEVLVYGTKI